VDEPGEVAPALLELAVELGEMAMDRSEPAEHLAQVAAAAREAPAGAGEQKPQIVARVAVERREDLVGVDVGRGVHHRQLRALLERGLRARARVELEEHVLQAGARAQQRGRVGPD
jgi:hypothetical protein